MPKAYEYNFYAALWCSLFFSEPRVIQFAFPQLDKP